MQFPKGHFLNPVQASPWTSHAPLKYVRKQPTINEQQKNCETPTLINIMENQLKKDQLPPVNTEDATKNIRDSQKLPAKKRYIRELLKKRYRVKHLNPANSELKINKCIEFDKHGAQPFWGLHLAENKEFGERERGSASSKREPFASKATTLENLIAKLKNSLQKNGTPARNYKLLDVDSCRAVTKKSETIREAFFKNLEVTVFQVIPCRMSEEAMHLFEEHLEKDDKPCVQKIGIKIKKKQQKYTSTLL